MKTACRRLLFLLVAAAHVHAAESAPGPEAKAPAAPLNGYAEVLKTKKPKASPMFTGKASQAAGRTTDAEAVAEIEMFVGESRVFPAPKVARVAVGNGSLLTAAALDNREVILFANQMGTSSLFIWNEDGNYQRLKINIVPGDTGRIARELAAFIKSIPNAKASVIGSNVVIEGEGLSDADAARIAELNKRYPQIVNFTDKLGWEKMVLLDVKVVEFPISELREIGMKWGATGGAAVAGLWSPGRRGSQGGLQVNIDAGGLPITSSSGGGAMPVPSGLNVLSGINLGLNAKLNLLAQDGRATILAQPQLSARNGSPASFLAGGEYPYTVSTFAGSSVQFKPYGVKLDIVPYVTGNGNVRATLETEVSNLDSSVSTSAGPAISTRKAKTEFNVKSGDTLVIAGLISRKTSANVDKVPLLGDLPVLGALFRSKRFQNDETELVVMVTPTVIDSAHDPMVERGRRAAAQLEQDKPVAREYTAPRPRAVPAPVSALGPARLSPRHAPNLGQPEWLP
jgi:pilus assembly protein CpaC